MEKKGKKNIKKYGVKKLPGVFKKKYSPKRFEKKIVNKIYLAKDRSDVQSIFSQNEKGLFCVPEDSKFTKDQIKRFKVIAGEMKGQKGRIKFLPLIVLVATLTVICGGVYFFKNSITKKVLVSVCESIAGAKTEIEYVNLEILSSKLTVRRIKVGNKNNVMTNIFEADKIELDFNLTQALRRNFDAQNLEVSGMDFNTPRATSCELPPKQKKKNEKKSVKFTDTAFGKSLERKTKNAIDALGKEASGVLGGSSVDEILENIQSQLKTPGVASDIQTSGEEMITAWSKVPDELRVQIDDFSKKVQNLQKIDFNNIKDVQTLKDTLNTINDAIVQGQALATKIDELGKNLSRDVESVSKMGQNVSNSINADLTYVSDYVNNILKVLCDPQAMFNNAIETIGYSYLGKYYPYAVELIDLAEYVQVTSQNRNSGKNSEEKVKKQNSKRLAGTTFWYKKQKPSFLIERLHVSGPHFEAVATDISNDMDLRGRPMAIKANFDTMDIFHDVSLIVDARTTVKNPLVQIEYLGSGFEVEFDGTTVAQKCGVPSLDGKAFIKLNGAFDAGLFKAGGEVSLNPVKLTSDGFENEIVTKYYNMALENVLSLSLGYDLLFSEEEGINMALTGNFANAFVQAFKNSAFQAANDAKKEAVRVIEEKLNEYSKIALEYVQNLTGIEADFNAEKLTLSSFQKQLEDMGQKIQKQLEEQARQTVNTAVNNAVNNALDSVQSQTGIDFGSALKGFGF